MKSEFYLKRMLKMWVLLERRSKMCEFDSRWALTFWSSCFEVLFLVFFSNFFQYLTNKNQFFFKSVHIFMKDAECAETNEKSNFRFLFFRVMVNFYSKHPNFWRIFTIIRKIKNLKYDFLFHFSRFRIVHKNLTISVGGGRSAYL